MSGDGSGEAREREKWRAYPDTILHFAGPPALRVDLRRELHERTRHELATLGFRGAFAVLTAENPEGEHAEDEESARQQVRQQHANAARTAALIGALDAAGLFHLPVEGTAPDGSYPERCVAVAIGREEAVALAARLGQLALFWFDGRKFWLLPGEADQPPVALPPT
jgi:hypothetical protein